MSVSNVNSIYGAQMGSNAGYDTPAIKIEEKESNIGAWLCGGLALVATLGVGIAAHKSGKAIASKDDNMFQTIWKGIKSWVGKNGDDVAKNIDDIPAECKTSFKTFFSGGEITSEQKQDIVDNADKISKVFSNKARNNATKADKLAEIAKTEKDDDKLKVLAQFFGVKGELKLEGETLKAVSAEDQAIIARKLKDTNESLITGSSIDDIIKGLQTKYKTKQKNYNSASSKIRNLTDVDTLKSATGSTDAVQSIIAKRLNRSDAAQNLVENCTDTSSYINTQASLTKWLKAGDLTQDEYDNLRALAEQKFMGQNNGNDYLNYMTQGLMKKDGKTAIELNKLDADDISTLNTKFPWLKEQSGTGTTSLTAETFVAKKKASATSISEYLGLNGAQIPSGWTIENNALHFKGSTTPSQISIGGKEISEFDAYQNKSGGKITGYTITLENLKNILNGAAQS